MDDLDLTEKSPRFDDDESPAPTRGSTILAPPPIPVRARRATTVPPPLPTGVRRAVPLPSSAGGKRPNQPPLFATTTGIGPSKLLPLLPPTPRDADLDDPPAEPPAPRASTRTTAPPPIPARSSGQIAVPLPRASSQFDAPTPATITYASPQLPAPTRARTSREIAVPPPGSRSSGSIPIPPVRPSTRMAAQALPVVDPAKVPAHEESSPFAFDEPHVARTPLPSFDIDVDDTPAPDSTSTVPRRNTAAIAGIAVGVIVVGVVLFLGLRGGSKEAAPEAAPPPPVIAQAPALETIPAPPPARVAEALPPVSEVTAPIAEPPAPAPVPIEEAAPALVDLPIASTPSDAVVTLISEGDATVLGRTPLTASIDPTQSYDIVIALKDHPTKVTHVDPGRAKEIAVDLSGEAATRPSVQRRSASKPTAMIATPAAKPVTAPTKTIARPNVAATKPEPPSKRAAVATPDWGAPAKAPPKRVAAAPATTGVGVLMISAKPPCAIAIDGKATKLTTPQRAIELAAGTHTITLTNSQQKIAKTFSVKITAKQATKVIQDFTTR